MVRSLRCLHLVSSQFRNSGGVILALVPRAVCAGLKKHMTDAQSVTMKPAQFFRGLHTALTVMKRTRDDPTHSLHAHTHDQQKFGVTFLYTILEF